MCAKKMTPDDPKFVDAPDGHLQSLVHSGMQPVFKDKKASKTCVESLLLLLTVTMTQTFGRVPGYLQRFRRAKEEDQLRWEEERRQERDRMESMKLSKEEREGILEVQAPKRQFFKGRRRLVCCSSFRASRPTGPRSTTSTRSCPCSRTRCLRRSAGSRSRLSWTNWRNMWP